MAGLEVLFLCLLVVATLAIGGISMLVLARLFKGQR